MRSALYYPHTQITNEEFLKNCLLLWDEVNFISPTRHFRFQRELPVEIIESLELLCRPHVPTEEEKAIAHNRIARLIEHGIPEWLVTTNVPKWIREGRQVREFYGQDYGIYPQKLDSATWQLLEEAGLVRLNGADYDYYTRPLVGLYLMSLLANVCAGTTKEQITDRADAYSVIWRLCAAEGGAQYLESTSSISTDLERLITVSVHAINSEKIPLKNILALRKREAGGAGHDYRAFRRKYGEKIQECALALATKAKSKSDRYEIERQFQQDMKDDIASLKEELRITKVRAFFSKTMLTTVIAGVASFSEPITASALLTSTARAIATGALITDLIDFYGKYKDVLSKHSASWLYLAQRPIRDFPIRNYR